jgi:hypothetical protein
LKRAGLFALMIVLGTMWSSSRAAAAELEWHSEQPVAAGIGVPVALGKVGGMAFWSPNKGVLVTAGTGGTPAGVYAYDGSGWYLYSTVCGGEGGIAISGPDEFWTISNYGEAQEGEPREGELDRTLCHFANGQVVGSYAEPVGSTEAYAVMNAAACEGPADCWFAGNTPLGGSANKDPFHLHWDGASITAIPSQLSLEPEVAPMPGNAEGLAFTRGRLFESASKAPFLREVSLASPARFLPIEPPAGTPGPFVLSSEPFQQELWAGSHTGAVLHFDGIGFETVPTESPIFEGETFVGGLINSIGAEPGTEAAWLGGGSEAEAEVRRVTADGSLGPILHLPGPAEELNPKGPAEDIVCPATNQCWMVTSKGWLFHLGGPPAEGVNTDPAMHRLITSRPQDPSSRTLPEAELPPDDSGEVETHKSLGEEKLEPFPEERPAKSCDYDVKQKLIGKQVLQLSFKLRVRCHVQLKAKYRKKVVAKTPLLTLGKGPHKLQLKLDPKRWPTGVDFQVHPVEKKSSK